MRSTLRWIQAKQKMEGNGNQGFFQWSGIDDFSRAIDVTAFSLWFVFYYREVTMIKRDEMGKFKEIIAKREPDTERKRYRHFFFFFYDGLIRAEEFTSLVEREIGTLLSFLCSFFFSRHAIATFCSGGHCFQGSLEDLLHRGHDLTRRFTSPRVETEIWTCPSVL